MTDSSTTVPTISITTPELKVEDCLVPSGSVTPESPTIFEFVKEIEKQQKAGAFDSVDSKDGHEEQSQQQSSVDEAIALGDNKEVDRDSAEENKTRDLLNGDRLKSHHSIDASDPTQASTVQSFYHGKSILITGATGFIGKTVLWKLIQSLSDSVDRIYLLFTQQHSRQRLTARGRFHEDILSNKAFTSLRRSMGSALFDDFVDRKVYPLYCDLTEKNIGLSDSDIQWISDPSLQQELIIFHCAGSMDGTDSIHQSVKTNTYGTLQLYNFVKKTQSWKIAAFIHLSILQPQFKNGSEKYLYPLPFLNSNNENQQQPSVMEILGDCMNPESDIIEQLQQQQNSNEPNNLYKNPYLLAKSLTEHVLVDQVIRNKEAGFKQIPMVIMRLSLVGPSVQEPLIGWADGVNGLNGIILLTGKGNNKVIQANSGHTVADVIPVDYVVRLMLCSAVTIAPFNTGHDEIMIPKPIPSHLSTPASVPVDTTESTDNKQSTMLPSEYAASKRPSATSRHKRTSSVASNRRSFQLYSSSMKNLLPPQQYTIPMIYHVSSVDKRPLNWRMAYDAIRQYWVKATNITLLPAKSYFTGSSYAGTNPSPRNSLINGTTTTAVAAAEAGLSRARTVMSSLRGYYSGATNNESTKRNSLMSQHQQRSGKNNRSSHRWSRTLDKANNSVLTTKDAIYHSTLKAMTNANDATLSSAKPMEYISNVFYLIMSIKHMVPASDQRGSKTRLNTVDLFDPSLIIPEDTAHQFWVNYFLNASYGIHYFVCQEITHTRLPTPIFGWNCSIQPVIEGADDEETDYYQEVIARQVNSIIFSQDQVAQRTNRMVQHIKYLLQHPDVAAAEMRAALQQKNKDNAWLTDLDDALDDWSQDDDVLQYADNNNNNSNANKDYSSHRTITMALGKWRRRVGSSDDSVKVIVLNDKRVNQAITHITQKAGVSKQTAVNEAIKILMRMSERTQLTFVWFTGSFLRSVLNDMFDHVRISEDQLRVIRQSTMGKRVVYVPVSKSMLDPLLVWYLAIRYHLPIPALACDEVLAHMGPISDVYRLAGAYYIKRDKSKRSPLNSAVTAAYTQVLLREHGALSFCLERSRSRTGKYTEAYPDGFVDMIIEATLQTNQGTTSRGPSSNYSSGATIGNTFSRIASAEMASPPESPSSAVTTDSISSTLSMESTASKQPQFYSQRKVHKDVVFVPLNITYENVPELSYLIDQVLESQPATTAKASTLNRAGTLSSRPPLISSMSSPPSSTLSTIPQRSSTTTMMRPSEAKDRRKTLLSETQNGFAMDMLKKKGGHVTFGVGPLVSVQEVAEEVSRQMMSDEGSALTNSYEEELVIEITKRIHESQCAALVVSPVSMVAAIILYGRATHGVCVGKIKDLMEWMKKDIIQHYGYSVDWQEGEDLETIILTSFKLLDETKNIIVEGATNTKDYITDDNTSIRVNDHADNVMTLSYYANQMVDIFLLDAFFAVVYLSFLENDVLLEEFKDRFRFLLQLLEKEFVLLWNLEDKFSTVIDRYIAKRFIRLIEEDNKSSGMKRLGLLVNMENDPVRYEQMIFLASLVYPTIDAYWITSCSLSALEAVPMLPRCIVPLLTQWIATHLITGRRTLYREVLSTESSKIAVDVFMTMGFLHEIQSKEKLSPDAQILLHELGVPTSEILIELTGQNKDGGKTPISPKDPEGMMKAVMAQIQMNRANSNMADLCQQIDTYRLGAASQRESFQNAQVFQKCLRQIRGILQANTSFAKRRHIELPSEDEDGLVQLVYSLLASSVPASGDRAAQVRALRRISEAYNLR